MAKALSKSQIASTLAEKAGLTKKQAAQILHAGGIAAIPTDSSYALVCHLDDKDAAAAAFARELDIDPTNGKRAGPACPVTTREAFLAGVPVVASRIGGIPELVRHGDNGLLVAPRDPVALAQAIQRLAELRQCRQCVLYATHRLIG